MSPVLHLHIGLNVPRQQNANWGDTQYAEGLATALRAMGHQTTLFFHGETPGKSGAGDVVLWIIGPHLEEPIAGLPNLLWIISPPNLLPIGTLARYQAIFTASSLLAKIYQTHDLPAHYLPQASDPEHFNPGQREEGAAEIPITFVGRYASRAPRFFVREVIEAGFDMQIWGAGWKGKAPVRMLRGDHVTPDELAQIYARSRVVLNDHMPHMARLGMMSNRAYDAIACGAYVISDPVKGFSADLPLSMVNKSEDISARLAALLDAPPASLEERWARNRLIRAKHSFASAAQQIETAAQRALMRGEISPRACRSIPFAAREAEPVDFALRLSELPQAEAAAPEAANRIAEMDAHAQGAKLRLELHISDPASGISGEGQSAATLRAAREAQAIGGLLARHERIAALRIRRHGAPPAPLHAMMSPLRAMQALLEDLDAADLMERAEQFSLGPRRLIEATTASDAPSSHINPVNTPLPLLHHVLAGKPLHPHTPQDFQRNHLKSHINLQPRRQTPTIPRPVGVFLHLYYDDLAEIFAARLAHIHVPLRLYVSTDSTAKAARIRQHLPKAEIRVMANRGRDIYPKFYGFSDRYEDHDFILHLHGKKSEHSGKLDAWLTHILDCLLPSAPEVNRILSLLSDIPTLGLVAPVPFQSILPAQHWSINFEIAQELNWRIGGSPLPGNDWLRFPAGSMFWGRTAALRPLLDLKLEAEHFPAEAGQLDGTTSHAIERMLGVVCTQTGHEMLCIAGQKMRLYNAFRHEWQRNRDIRDLLSRTSR